MTTLRRNRCPAITVAIAAIGCSMFVLSASSVDSPIDTFLEAQYEPLSQVASLPANVRQVVLATKEGMADPGEEFDCCCIVSDEVPDRRLILAGTSPEWSFLFYEQGEGRAGTHYLLTVYVTSRGLDEVVFTAEVERRRPPKKMKGLKASIAAGDYCLISGNEEAKGVPNENMCLERWSGLTKN